MEVGPLYTQSGSLLVLTTVHVGLKNDSHRFWKTKNQIYVLVENRGYNAGQKKRNSDLRIFHAPPDGGGSTLNTVQHTQTIFKVDLPLPGSSQKIHGSELRFF